MWSRGFEVAYATTAGDQIRVPLVDARGRCGWSRFRLFDYRRHRVVPRPGDRSFGSRFIEHMRDTFEALAQARSMAEAGAR